MLLLRERHPVARYDDPDGSGEVVITESNEYDRATQVNRIKWHYEIGTQPERIVENNVRIFFPQELDALLRWSGFRIDSKFGDYDRTPFESNSRKQLAVCAAHR
ncbi:hypothetical protein AMJ39_09695 [candidate division TA06 bacterium DG_24]|uniref:Uncharacterized protein n=1 Tax=candidate division TA06 bacterium DG_24 TaxID=1703770 RepID=A0A0S7WMY9_UNCT6|nr:MAG: hypothetical protein AMJ39_09695 [candidate division TA06 bacterium DG_24]